MTWARRSGSPTVYFIHSDDPIGHIKIGCSQAPILRAQSLGGMSPFRLTILASISGDEVLERRFHLRFAALRGRGEWFKADAAIWAVVEEIRRGHFDVASLPAPAPIPYARKRGDGFSGLSASMANRITALGKRGIFPPDEVDAAALRFSNNPYRIGWDAVRAKRDVADARIVIAWLEGHSPVPERMRACIEGVAP